MQLATAVMMMILLTFRYVDVAHEEVDLQHHHKLHFVWLSSSLKIFRTCLRTIRRTVATETQPKSLHGWMYRQQCDGLQNTCNIPAFKYVQVRMLGVKFASKSVCMLWFSCSKPAAAALAAIASHSCSVSCRGALSTASRAHCHGATLMCSLLWPRCSPTSLMCART